MKFCFPERDTDNIEGDGARDADSGSNGSGNLNKKNKFSNTNEKPKKWKETNFYVPISMKDDVEKMKVLINSPKNVASFIHFFLI